MSNFVNNENNELVGVGVGFESIRRITGYLVGDTSKWNDAKQAELHDRVKHTVTEIDAIAEIADDGCVDVDLDVSVGKASLAASL